jgi:hypothetical protein
MKLETHHLKILALSLSLWGLAGCASVPVYEQGLVSQNRMTFSDNPVQNDQINLLSQIEPGSAVSGGGQAAGCTACR